MQLLPDYFAHSVHARFISKKMFYILYMPMQMAKYSELKEEFIGANREIDWKTGMIERATMLGRGTIGLAHESGDWQIDGEFIGYRIVGAYSQMRSAYAKIRKDYPKAHNFYNIYHTDPKVTPMEDNITDIIFQIQP